MSHPLSSRTDSRYRKGGMYDDVAQNIRNDQREAPDPNPYIPCARCEDRFKFEEYWKPRYVDPDDVNPHEAEWLCDGCKELKRRQERNHDVEQWITPNH